MITVQTDYPVYSNVKGDKKARQPKETKTNKNQDRKAKRNARRLIRVTRKNGKKVFVYPLTKLKPISKFSGGDGNTTIVPVVAQPTEYTKTFPDGTSITIPANRVFVHSTGVYDKNDIAQIFNVDPSILTQQMIDAYIVGMPPASKNATQTTETDANANSDTGIVVPDKNVVVDDNGNAFVDKETQPKAEPDKDVKDEQKDQKSSMQKYFIWGGIILAIGVIGYFVLKQTGKK